MSAPLPIRRQTLPSINESPEVKTFRPAIRCAVCKEFSTSTKLVEMLMAGEKTHLCSKCLMDQFKAIEEHKAKKLKTYQITPFPLPKVEKKE